MGLKHPYLLLIGLFLLIAAWILGVIGIATPNWLERSDDIYTWSMGLFRHCLPIRFMSGHRCFDIELSERNDSFQASPCNPPNDSVPNPRNPKSWHCGVIQTDSKSLKVVRAFEVISILLLSAALLADLLMIFFLYRNPDNQYRAKQRGFSMICGLIAGSFNTVGVIIFVTNIYDELEVYEKKGTYLAFSYSLCCVAAVVTLFGTILFDIGTKKNIYATDLTTTSTSPLGIPVVYQNQTMMLPNQAVVLPNNNILLPKQKPSYVVQAGYAIPHQQTPQNVPNGYFVKPADPPVC